MLQEFILNEWWLFPLTYYKRNLKLLDLNLWIKLIKLKEWCKFCDDLIPYLRLTTYIFINTQIRVLV